MSGIPLFFTLYEMKSKNILTNLVVAILLFFLLIFAFGKTVYCLPFIFTPAAQVPAICLMK
jgi:hypothetical protein